MSMVWLRASIVAESALTQNTDVATGHIPTNVARRDDGTGRANIARIMIVPTANPPRHTIEALL